MEAVKSGNRTDKFSRGIKRSAYGSDVVVEVHDVAYGKMKVVGLPFGENCRFQNLSPNKN